MVRWYRVDRPRRSSPRLASDDLPIGPDNVHNLLLSGSRLGLGDWQQDPSPMCARIEAKRSPTRDEITSLSSGIFSELFIKFGLCVLRRSLEYQDNIGWPTRASTIKNQIGLQWRFRLFANFPS
jgi:hypothetical protein